MLQQELLSRTSLETQKLDLMAEISNLKIKLVGLEKEKNDCQESQTKAESVVNLINELQEQMCKLQLEINTKIQERETQANISEIIEPVHNTPSCDPPQPVKCSGCEGKDMLIQELKNLKIKVEELENERAQYEWKLKATKDAEIERLQSQISSRTIAQNESSEREEVFRRRIKEKHQEVQRLKLGMETLLAANEEKDLRIEELTLLLNQYRRVKNFVMATHGSSERLLSVNSEDEVESTIKKLIPKNNQTLELMKSESKVDPRYQTLPGKLSRSTPNGSHDGYRKPASQNALHINSELNGIQSLYIIRSASAPVIGETENNLDITFNDLSSSGTDPGPHSPLSTEGKKSPKGIKKFWGKIRRSPSGNFNTDELGLSEFKRGGMRATAGPRLSRTKDPCNKNSDYNAPFAQWSNEQVCNWLEDFGLGQYVIFARQWVSSGHTLLTATPQSLEKELGIKHPLHRKKLQLAVNAISSKKDEKSGQLDHVWVTRWLDDIGLPQYKDQFHEARVDGRMLQYLTVNDLLFLKVTSQLHHLSIKCAIHVLHANKFNPNCLRRRPADENNISPSEVVQWSNHRVMEWLRSVDLAEYAPNLRGSGVHGGLIILEPRFTSDTLAMLLNIPPQKTLLRRHLATNFSLLIGPEAQLEKREIMDSSTYTPLSTAAKVRPKKLGLSHFSNLRKKKFDDSTDYVCPVDLSPQKSDFKTPNNSSIKDIDKMEQVGRLI
ncbi:hypothetical protein GDO78_003940 [Eleutherodactylus coqui]|nr:hypothetical protein GDO78_003940 [Eleutherodactylus coqui]KAG9475793.1 hypothetical protein GDO78_003940 [Eleutherodactylus coqui]